MFGQEYLDWRDKDRVAGQIDEFLAAMPAEDRVWALAVLRERHVVCRDNPLAQLGRGLSDRSAFDWHRHSQCAQPHYGAAGRVLSGLFGF